MLPLTDFVKSFNKLYRPDPSLAQRQPDYINMHTVWPWLRNIRTRPSSEQRGNIPAYALDCKHFMLQYCKLSEMSRKDQLVTNRYVKVSLAWWLSCGVRISAEEPRRIVREMFIGVNIQYNTTFYRAIYTVNRIMMEDVKCRLHERLYLTVIQWCSCYKITYTLPVLLLMVQSTGHFLSCVTYQKVPCSFETRQHSLKRQHQWPALYHATRKCSGVMKSGQKVKYGIVYHGHVSDWLVLIHFTVSIVTACVHRDTDGGRFT